MEVTRTTGFAQGLYNTEESDAEQLKEKGAKLDFLNKAISATCFALGETVDVSASCPAFRIEESCWLKSEQMQQSSGPCSAGAVAAQISHVSLLLCSQGQQDRGWA